jgi:pyridoxine 5-phosphate synthase
MTLLSVNVNKIALLRNSREHDVPSVVTLAKLCEQAGADGITVHPRPDQRHIRPDDVYKLAGNTSVEFNIEGNPFYEAVVDYPGYLQLVRATKPTQATLVPDNLTQLTSDQGFDLTKTGEQLKPIIAELKNWGCRVSLFLSPDLQQVELAKKVGADRIELYTGPYADAFKLGEAQAEKAIVPYQEAARLATEIGLQLNAGHDLDLNNLGYFLQHVPNIDEVSIGHALIADALVMGLEKTVKTYRAITAARTPVSTTP